MTPRRLPVAVAALVALVASLAVLSGPATAAPTRTGTTPTGLLSRAAMAAFLYRYKHPFVEDPTSVGRADGDPTCATAPFTDVPVGAPFCGEIAWMKDAGVANGYGDDTFHPKAPVSRQATAAFVKRAYDARP